MSKQTSEYVKLKYGSSELWINAVSVDDDSFVLVRDSKQAVYLWQAVEKIRGWRRKVKVSFVGFSEVERVFMGNFLMCLDDSRSITVEGTEYFVRFRNPRLAVSLWADLMDVNSAVWELIEKSVNRTLERTYDVGTTDSATAAVLGHNLVMTYDYGDGEVSRRFRCDSFNSLDLELQRREWSYADGEPGERSLGLKTLTDVDLGCNALGSPDDKQDDRDWVREFLLAPTKTVSPVGGVESTVVLLSDEVDYDLEDGSGDTKSLKMQFKSVETSQSVPTI